MQKEKVKISITGRSAPKWEIKTDAISKSNPEKYLDIDTFEYTATPNEGGVSLKIVTNHKKFDFKRDKRITITGVTIFRITGAPENFFKDKTNNRLTLLLGELIFGQICELRGQMIPLFKGPTMRILLFLYTRPSMTLSEK